MFLGSISFDEYVDSQFRGVRGSHFSDATRRMPALSSPASHRNSAWVSSGMAFAFSRICSRVGSQDTARWQFCRHTQSPVSLHSGRWCCGIHGTRCTVSVCGTRHTVYRRRYMLQGIGGIRYAVHGTWVRCTIHGKDTMPPSPPR